MATIKTYDVEVQWEDINKGKRFDAWCCPVHHALWRATGQKWKVYQTWMVALEAPPCRTVALPTAVTRWINDFDGGRPVVPFSFQIAIPEANDGDQTHRHVLAESRG